MMNPDNKYMMLSDNLNIHKSESLAEFIAKD
jgi:hypothetical protein